LYRSGRGRVAFRPAFWRGGNHRTPSGLYRGRGRRGCLASLGGPPEWLGHLQFMPTPSEGDYGIFGWFWQSPVAGLIATLRGTCRPGLHEPRCARLTSILGLSGAVEHAGGASHVSFVDPRRSPFRALGLAMRRARERSALRPIRVHVGEARSQPTRCLVVFSQSCRSRPAAATVRGRGSLRLYPPTLRHSPDIHPSVASSTKHPHRMLRVARRSGAAMPSRPLEQRRTFVYCMPLRYAAALGLAPTAARPLQR
jgi:hypothetical protein